jgi:hypothetical protein
MTEAIYLEFVTNIIKRKKIITILFLEQWVWDWIRVHFFCDTITGWWWKERLVRSRDGWILKWIWGWFWYGPHLENNWVFRFLLVGVITFIGFSIPFGQSLTTDIWVFFSSRRGRWLTLWLQSFILLIFGICWSTMMVPNKEKWQKKFT